MIERQIGTSIDREINTSIHLARPFYEDFLIYRLCLMVFRTIHLSWISNEKDRPMDRYIDR